MLVIYLDPSQRVVDDGGDLCHKHFVLLRGAEHSGERDLAKGVAAAAAAAIRGCRVGLKSALDIRQRKI